MTAERLKLLRTLSLAVAIGFLLWIVITVAFQTNTVQELHVISGAGCIGAADVEGCDRALDLARQELERSAP
jgi:hypothetical protein